MRDPLAWVPVRLKLPLGFLCICVVAFGVGGVVLTQTAGDALEREIRHRLDGEVRATALSVERRLELYGRRVEDFASDGYIRVQTENLAAGKGGEDAAENLRRHLLENKLPLVAAFVDAAVLGPDGDLLLGARAPPVPPTEAHAAAGTFFGGLLGWTDAHPYPTFVIATPVQSLTGGRRIGTLALLVRADTWAEGVVQPATLDPAVPTRAALVDPAGVRLPLTPDPADDMVEETRYETPIERNGWICVLTVDFAAAMRPIADLRSRYVLIGLLLLVVVAAVLFFPMQFLLRPLNRIAEAARGIASGDFGTRVASESKDEIGDLSRAFNIMADAVQERTGQLERAAQTLERRERDIRFERDRLGAVIRSMEDGLFILGPDGKVILANAAAQPLLRGIQDAKRSPEDADCGREADAENSCLQCLAGGKSPARSCVVHIDSRFYDVRVTRLPSRQPDTEARICVSRDITTRVAEADQQSHQERMTVMGEVAAVMAHELNNPLAAISMFSQMLEGELEEGSELRENAAVILRNTETCKRSIRGLLDMAAQAAPEPGIFDIHDMLDDVRLLLRPVHQRAGVSVCAELDAADSRAFGDELQLRQVTVNLVLNAVQAVEGGGGEVVIRTRDAVEELEIEVCDDGPGVPEGLRERIFEPFFTTKPPGTGTGLGLPTSRRIVQAHRGSLDLVEAGERGATFRLRLPRDSRTGGARGASRIAEQVGEGSDGV